MRPLIGVATRNIVNPEYKIPYVASPRSYTESLIMAGALPVLLPLNTPDDRLDELLTRLDGLLLTGGGDIAIERFEGEAHEKVYGVDLERDEFELGLFEKVTAIEMPFLAICRGFQVVNVAMGGGLYTHISDQLDNALEHACFPPEHPVDHIAHTIEIEAGSVLAELVGGTSAEVNSLHHQGAQEIGKSLRVTATAPDGLVEGLELEGYPFGVAVQWHPEWMPGSVPMRNIFKGFLEAVKEYRG